MLYRPSGQRLQPSKVCLSVGLCMYIMGVSASDRKQRISQRPEVSKTVSFLSLNCPIALLEATRLPHRDSNSWPYMKAFA